MKRTLLLPPKRPAQVNYRSDFAVPTSAQLHTPIAQLWTPNLFDCPNAPPSQSDAERGHTIAETLLCNQGLYVYDFRAQLMVYASSGIEQLLGYSVANFTADFHYACIHSEDLPIVTEATVLANKYVLVHLRDPLSDLVFSVDYRIRHVQGHWLRVLQQNFIMSRDPSGAVVGQAAILTDISTHKHTHDVRFNLNRPDFTAFVREEQLHKLPVPLSNREQTIVALVLEGLTSCAIAQRLSLSTTTVQTHRRNIRHKVGTHSLHRLLQHL